MPNFTNEMTSGLLVVVVVVNSSTYVSSGLKIQYSTKTKATNIIKHSTQTPYLSLNAVFNLPIKLPVLPKHSVNL